MFCKECGAKLDEGVAFCKNCGTKVENPETAAQSAVQEKISAGDDQGVTEVLSVNQISAQAEQTKESVAQETVENVAMTAQPSGMPVHTQEPSAQSGENQTVEGKNPAKEEKKAKKGKREHRFLSFLLCLLIAILSLYLVLSFLVRRMTSEDQIENIVSQLDIKKIAVASDSSKDEGTQDLSKMIYDSIPQKDKDRLNITEDSVNKIIDENSAAINEFFQDKLKDYVDDFYNGTGKGSISVKDIKELWEDNQAQIKKSVEDATGYVMTEKDTTYIENFIQTDASLEDALSGLDLSEVRRANEDIFKIANTVVSTWLMIVAGVVILLFVIFVFALQARKIKAFKYLGKTMIYTGILVLLIAAATGLMMGMILNSLSGTAITDSSFWTSLLSPVQKNIIYVGSGLVGGGILFCIIYGIGNAIYKASLKKQNAQ